MPYTDSEHPATSRANVAAARPLWRGALLAVVLAMACNAALFTGARSAGLIPATLVVPQRGQAIDLATVVGASWSAVVIAALVYALLRRTTRRPVRAFRALALAVLLVAALPPLLIGAPASAIAVLELMHVVTAAVVLWALTGESSGRAPR